MSASFHVEDEIQQKAYDARIMARLLVYVRPYKAWLIAAVALLLVASLISSFSPLIIMHAIDGPIGGYADSNGGDAKPGLAKYLWELLGDVGGRPERLGHFIGLLCGLFVVETFVRYAQLVIVAWIGQKAMLEMRVRIFEHLQTMSLAFLDRHPVGRLMTRVTNDVEKIQNNVVAGMVQVASDLVTIAVVLAFMLWASIPLTVITLSTVPFVFLTSYLFRKYSRRSYLEIRRKIAVLNSYLQENVSGMRVVQIFNREHKNYEEYRDKNASHRDEWFRQIRYFAYYFPVVDFLGTLSLALIIWYHGADILARMTAGTGTFSLGILIAFVYWSERLFTPIRALADRYNMLLEAMAASERIFELLDTPDDVPNAASPVEAASLRGDIVFDDVVFGYDPARPVLKGISFSIAPGERVAIVGHTGAGKTTIANLLSRFYDIQSGNILIDGVNVRDYEKTSLRRRIGVVLQDVFMFSGTVGFNIRLGDDAISDEKVRSCAEYVNASRFIDALPGKYDYDVGERGCNLSTGQRQLLAFARALAHDPDILVLDEATSNVDTATEALIQDAIIKLMEGRTSLVIAHRLSTVQHCDRIIVMHHGEIRESGTHRELLAQRGLYWTLYRLQYKDQDSAA
ncbi:MAG: ABC transporter ATP-binding protein [Candidatus Hydrogenedentota bacterium]